MWACAISCMKLDLLAKHHTNCCHYWQHVQPLGLDHHNSITTDSHTFYLILTWPQLPGLQVWHLKIKILPKPVQISQCECHTNKNPPQRPPCKKINNQAILILLLVKWVCLSSLPLHSDGVWCFNGQNLPSRSSGIKIYSRSHFSCSLSLAPAVGKH